MHYTRVLLWCPCTVFVSFTRAGSMIELRMSRRLFSISDTKLELFILGGYALYRVTFWLSKHEHHTEPIHPLTITPEEFVTLL